MGTGGKGLGVSREAFRDQASVSTSWSSTCDSPALLFRLLGKLAAETLLLLALRRLKTLRTLRTMDSGARPPDTSGP